MAFTFEEWVDEHYNDNRPVEPCCAGENPEQWAQIADYAEKKLKTAFIDAVEDYIDLCKAAGKPNEKS